METSTRMDTSTSTERRGSTRGRRGGRRGGRSSGISRHTDGDRVMKDISASGTGRAQCIRSRDDRRQNRRQSSHHGEAKATRYSPTQRSRNQPKPATGHNNQDSKTASKHTPGQKTAIRPNHSRFKTRKPESSPTKTEDAPRPEYSQATNETVTVLKNVLARRYDPMRKVLDLSALGNDPDLAGMFTQTKEPSKIFAALMKICDREFPTEEDKKNAITAVSVANNNLTTLKPVTTLAQTFPHLEQIDLSLNKIDTIKPMLAWRWKFRDLSWLSLQGSKVCEEEGFQSSMLKWYPKLITLNGIIVREAKTPPFVPQQPSPVQQASAVAQPVPTSVPGPAVQPSPSFAQVPVVPVQMVPAASAASPNSTTLHNITPTVQQQQAQPQLSPPPSAIPSATASADEKLAYVISETGLNVQYATMALEGNNWNLEATARNFMELKAAGNIPAEAFA